MPLPIAITRIQQRRGVQSQFDLLYPPGYDGTGGFGSIPGYTVTNYPNILSSGEIALCTDTARTFIGNINGTFIELATSIVGGGGTVTSVDVSGSSDITSSGGPITSSGIITLSLTDTDVIPGDYTSANIEVDAKGRIVDVASGVGATSTGGIYLIDIYSTTDFNMNGNLVADSEFEVGTVNDTGFAKTIVTNQPEFLGIEFLASGKYKVTINYIVDPLSGEWPSGVSSHGFDLETLSTDIVGNQFNLETYMLKSVNTSFNISGEDGLSSLPGNGPSADDVSTSNIFILDANIGSILWPAIYVKSFETSYSALFAARLVIERI